MGRTSKAGTNFLRTLAEGARRPAADFQLAGWPPSRSNPLSAPIASAYFALMSNDALNRRRNPLLYLHWRTIFAAFNLACWLIWSCAVLAQSAPSAADLPSDIPEKFQPRT